MNIDEAIHAVYEAFTMGVMWHDFLEIGLVEDYYDWYYAEDGLYVIRDRVMEQYYFVKARSPGEALHKFQELAYDIARAAYPVVRCRECKHGERERAANGDWMILCHQPKALDEWAMMPPEWYCADGEREEERDG